MLKATDVTSINCRAYMEEKESEALNVVREVVEGGAFFYLTGSPRDVAVLYLIRRVGKNRVRLINPQFPPVVSQRSFFIEKLRRLWGVDIQEEDYPKLDGTYSDEEKFQKILGSFKSRGGKTLILSSQGGELFSEKDGIILIRPLCSFSDADSLEYIEKYRLPLCSVDKEEADVARPEACSGNELSCRLKDLGYL